MIYRLAADVVLATHLAFVLFAVFGGVLALRFREAVWAHLPAAGWAVLVSAASWTCPLTPLENHFRRLGGQAGYDGGFIEHYLVPVLYPHGLTHGMQLGLAALVLVVNAAIYVRVWRSRRRTATGTLTATTPSRP
jgi:hypothetical protein